MDQRLLAPVDWLVDREAVVEDLADHGHVILEYRLLEVGFGSPC